MTKSFDKYLKENNPYINIIKEDNAINKKGKENNNNDIPPDYDPNWADEF